MKMRQRVMLCLEEEQLIEMQRVMMDEDEQGALNFLTSVVWPKLEATMRGDMQKEIDNGRGVEQFWSADKGQ